MSVRFYFESCKKCKRAGSTTDGGKCYHCGADYTKELGMPHPAPEAMTPEQIATQTRRLFLEEMICLNQKYLWDIKKECKEHVVVKGRILFSPAKNKVVNTHEGWVSDCCSASCAICGEDFGWWCPKSPTHYCEYDESDTYGCKWCHEPDERK